MLSSLLTQFRQRYPQGSLTSDLLTIHDGLYVVRVCAGVDGRVLTSGLSANTTLELAEDGATTRALERLSFSGAQPPALAPPVGLDTLGEAQTTVSRPGPALPGLAGAIAPETPSDAFKAAPEAAPAAIPLRPQVASPALTLVPSSPNLEPVAHPPAPELPAVALASPWPQEPAPSPAPSPKVFDEPPDEPANEFADLGPGPGASVDLSDIIAQTDVELQRLGWGVNQGREFLEKTYGKRSRHDLTDDELLEFLLFLETQPTPGGP